MTRYKRFPSMGRVVAVLALLMLVSGREAASVSAQSGSSECPAYEIEGSIEKTTEEGTTSRVAVYLHIGTEPVIGHRVFATFADVDGVEVGEPLVLTTGDDGRAMAPVPLGAVSVSFVADSPDQPACLAAPGTEPRVSLEIRASTGEPVDPDGQLAHTGPVTAGVAAAAVLAAALGCGVWMGRGRKDSDHELASGRG